MLTRRAFLRAAALLGAGLGVGRPVARALGEREKFQIAQVMYGGGNWQPRPTALRRLLWEIDKRTSIDVRLDPVTLHLADPELYRAPFLYLAGDAAFAPPSESDVEQLRRHLQAGGFLVVDGCESRPPGALAGGFDRSVRALAARLFPSEPLGRLADDHVIFKSFYLLHTPAGRTTVIPYLEGVLHDGRAALVYCQNDLGGAWARDNFGRWEFDVQPGGDDQREHAFRLGVNLALYATCLDYKTDQVHVPFILRRRRWRVP